MHKWVIADEMVRSDRNAIVISSEPSTPVQAMESSSHLGAAVFCNPLASHAHILFGRRTVDFLLFLRYHVKNNYSSSKGVLL